MTVSLDQLEYRVLTESETEHHVVLAVLGTPWMQMVATFRDRTRAKCYADIEDMALGEFKAGEASQPASEAERADPPVVDTPPSFITVENFRQAAPAPSLPAGEGEVTHDHRQMLVIRVPVAAPAPVRTETAILDHSGAHGSAGEAIPASSPSGSPAGPHPQPSPTQVTSPAQPAAAESAAGTNSDLGSPAGTPAAGAPVQPADGTATAKPAVVERAAGTLSKPTNKPFGAGLAAKEEPVRAKPATSSMPTARDPLLARDNGMPMSGKALAAEEHPGSAGQQLADRILADLPHLMTEFPLGPLLVDLAERYGVPPVRVNDAVMALFARRKIRLDRFSGNEQHIVPPGFELASLAKADRDGVPAPKLAKPGSITARNEAAVLDFLRTKMDAERLVSGVTLASVVKETGVPMGSMGAALSGLMRAGALAIVRRANANVPATYRLSEGVGA